MIAMADVDAIAVTDDPEHAVAIVVDRYALREART